MNGYSVVYIYIYIHSWRYAYNYRDVLMNRSLLNRVLACFARLRACVLTCLACLRACVLTCLGYLHAYVLMCLTCLRVCVLTCLTCLRAYVLTCLLACVFTHVLVMMKYFIFLPVCVLGVGFCLIYFTFQYLNLNILTTKKLCALLTSGKNAFYIIRKIKVRNVTGDVVMWFLQKVVFVWRLQVR